jgi:hypothetical protein
VNTIEEEAPPGRRRRRSYSREFKAQLVAACQGPGVSIAAIALHHQLNANLLRRWVDQADAKAAGRTDGHALAGATFVGVVEASWLTGWATAMQTFSPKKDLGKVVAVDTFVTSGAHPFIYLGGGLVGETVGYSHTLTIAAVVSAIACRNRDVLSFEPRPKEKTPCSKKHGVHKQPVRRGRHIIAPPSSKARHSSPQTHSTYRDKSSLCATSPSARST